MFAAALSSLIPTRAAYRNASIENPRYSLDDPALYDMLSGGVQSESGVKVTHDRALNLAAVWQALSQISGDIAKLPLYPYSRLKDDDREVATKHPGYYPCAIKANPEKSAFQHRRDRAVHLLMWNNSYDWITRGRGGKIELYNLLPDRTSPEWVKLDSGELMYMYVTEVAGKLEYLLPSQVLHLRGISFDGQVGYDLIKAAREAWGLALSAQGFQSKFYKNGARIGGTLELPAAMPKTTMDKVEEGFRKHYEGGDNPFKTVIAREGVKFHTGQFSPEQSLVSESTEQGKRDVASYFNLPPSKLGIRDSVSYNSFEQDNLSYLHGCLHHWLATEADECDMKLLTPRELEDDSVYFAHNVSKFTQADWKTLNEGLEIMRRNEIINADEWRRKIDMNKRPDGKGGEYLNPNTKSAESQKPEQKTEDKPPAKPAKNVTVNEIEEVMLKVASPIRSQVDAMAVAVEAASRVGADKAGELLKATLEVGKATENIGGLIQESSGGLAKAIGDEAGSIGQLVRDRFTEQTTELQNRDARAAAIWRPLVVEALRRYANRFAGEGRRAAKTTSAFSKWLTATVDDDLILASAGAVADFSNRAAADVLRDMRVEMLASVRQQLQEVASGSDTSPLGPRVEPIFDELQKHAPERVATKLFTGGN